MAIPRVFVSSTFYDLRYVRENLKFFIRNMGFEPVLSETGGVFYDPDTNIQDACLAEVGSCQLFVLIVGGRFGSTYREGPDSVVNHEYRKAIELKVPVFALVEQQVHAENRVYQANKARRTQDAGMVYPSVDSTKVFDFLEEVQDHTVNNALVPFRDYSEMESYLKQQWAGMMHSFLTGRAERERVADMLASLTAINQKVEFLSKQILTSVGSDISKTTMRLYDLMLRHVSIQDLVSIGAHMTPFDVLNYADYSSLIAAKRVSIREEDDGINWVSGSAPQLSPKRFRTNTLDYDQLRSQVVALVKKDFGGTPEDFAAKVATEDTSGDSGGGSSSWPSEKGSKPVT